MIQRRAVDRDPAAHRPPDADHHPHEGRFARSARPDDPQPIAAPEREAHILHDQLLLLRRRDAYVLDCQRLGRIEQLHRRLLRRQQRQELREPGPALPGRDKPFPIGDGKVDRGQRAGGQDGAGDDDARRCLLQDHQIGAHSQHGGLQQQAQHLGDGGEAAADVAHPAMARHVLPVGLGPARRHAAHHTHGHQRLGVAAAGFGKPVARCGKQRCLGAGCASQQLGEKRQHDENDAAAERRQADPGMEEITDGDEHRHPRQIVERDRPRARQKRTDAVEIAQGLQTVLLISDQQRQSQDAVVDAPAQDFIEGAPDPHQNPSPDQVENPLRGVKAAGQRHQPDERRHAAARQHPVVDFQHEHRPGQHQDVAHGADQADADEGAPAGRQRGRKFGAGRTLRRARRRARHQLCSLFPVFSSPLPVPGLLMCG